MSNKQRHEYELKFRVGTDRKSIPTIRHKLKAAGLNPGSRCIETDYLPDTPDDVCKKAKMLLRFRQVEGAATRELLLTLKIKQTDRNILHFQEYETDLYAPDMGIITLINDLLRAQTGLELSGEVLRAESLDQVKQAVRTLGLTKHRILLNKYRENFSLGEDNVTIDYFPDGMGVYVEFESHTPAALQNQIKQAGFTATDGTETDYGDLLKLHKAASQDQAQRTALFSKAEMTILRELMKDAYDG